MRRRIIIVLVVVLVIFATRILGSRSDSEPSNEMTEAQIAQVDAVAGEAIAERWESYRLAWLSGNADEILSYWTEDMTLWEPGAVMGKNEYEIGLREFLNMGGTVSAFDVESYEVFVHGDVVYQIGQIDLSIQAPGQEPADFANFLFARWEKQNDGVWRVSRAMNSPREPSPEG